MLVTNREGVRSKLVAARNQYNYLCPT